MEKTFKNFNIRLSHQTQSVKMGNTGLTSRIKPWCRTR
jgi:hypothetical protein